MIFNLPSGPAKPQDFDVGILFFISEILLFVYFGIIPSVSVVDCD